MFKHYYVNDIAQSDGYHEVHSEDCSFVPNVNNRTYLGYFNNCKDAVKKAKNTYLKSDGCFWCCRPCHTR